MEVPGMEVAEVWRHVEAQRRALRTHLETLSEDEWAVPSLCAGWTVRDVAAHVIATPQCGWSDFAAMMVRGGFRFNHAILKEGRRRGRAEPADILRQYDEYAAARVTPPGLTPLDPLADVLVHTQDLLRPLGREHEMPREAAAAATERSLRLGWAFGTRHLGALRWEATDLDWSRGDGPVLRGPIQELLLVATGRGRAARLLEGDGLARLGA